VERGAEMNSMGARLVAYAAECMDWHEIDADQEQNQVARHMAQFSAREVEKERERCLAWAEAGDMKEVSGAVALEKIRSGAPAPGAVSK